MSGAVVASAVTGHTGVLHAGAQLSHRGWEVSLTLAGAPRVDLFPQRPDRPAQLLAVQVKAEQGGVACFGDGYLQLGSKNFDGYRDAWETLDKDAEAAPWRLPRWHWGWRADWEHADRLDMPLEAPADAPDV